LALARCLATRHTGGTFEKWHRACPFTLDKEPVMFLRSTLVLFLCTASGLARAQDIPENLLPAGTQVYARWDGVDAHRAAYLQTALGKMLQGDTGKFLSAVVTQLQDYSGSLLTSGQLLKGVPPARLQQIQVDATEAPKLLPLLAKHGVIIGVEVRSLEPPAAQLMLIVPDAGPTAAPLFGTLHLLTSLADIDAKELKVAGRAVHYLNMGPVHASWWVEGKHAVISVGTDQPDAAIRRMLDATKHLPENPLFKRVQGFNGFETGARAFVDVAALVRIAKSRSKEVSKLITDVGLDDLKSWTFYSGFAGAAERTLSELEAPQPRRGLLLALSSKPFRLAELPPIPPDALSWSATNFDPGLFYDASLKVAESVVALFSPDSAPHVKDYLKLADNFLGINLRDDLLGALGSRFVQYTASAEGPFVFGQTYLFKVKDAKKLTAALEQLAKTLGKLVNVEVRVRKGAYQGVQTYEVHVRQQGFLFVPTFAIHEDWIALSYFPQAVHGFILRATKALPSWQADPRMQATLDQLPKEFVSISVSDPSPTIRQFLSLAPLIGGLVESFATEAKFDVSNVPNAYEVTQHLFPNVSVVTDDGNCFRSETRASLILPVDFGGLDTYALFASFGFLRMK